jgi:uncharacterized membrane protein
MTSPGLNNFHCIALHMILEERAQKTGLRRLYKGLLNAYVKEECISTLEKSIEVNMPVHTAYNQWTQFKEFPRFMEGIKEVKQLDDKRLHWKAEIAGQEKRVE